MMMNFSRFRNSLLKTVSTTNKLGTRPQLLSSSGRGLSPSSYAQSNVQRSFFSLPSFPTVGAPAGVQQDHEVGSLEDLAIKDRFYKRGDVLVYKETKRLPYTKEQLYQTIADVDSYPNFMPYCTQSSLFSSKALGINNIDDPNKLNTNTTIENHSKIKPWLNLSGYHGQAFLLESEISINFKGFEDKYLSITECRKFDMIKTICKNSNLFKQIITTFTFKSPTEINSILINSNSNSSSSLFNNNDEQKFKNNNIINKHNEDHSFISLEMSLDLSDHSSSNHDEFFWKSICLKKLLNIEKQLFDRSFSN